MKCFTIYEDLKSHLLTLTQLAEESTALTVLPIRTIVYNMSVVIWYIMSSTINLYLIKTFQMSITDSILQDFKTDSDDTQTIVN